MKRSLMTILVILFIMSLLSGCAVRNAEGWDPNYPPPKRKATPVTQKTYPNEIFATTDFKVSSGEWYKPEKFAAYVARKKQVAPTGLQAQHEADILALKPMQVRMSKEIKEGNTAFCAVYFFINSGVNINLQKGGLILTFRDPQGNTVEVPDKGCLFVSFKGVIATLHDSSRRSVRFNRNFNDKPDYAKMGNLVCVRIDPQYEDWKLISLKLEPQKISMLQ